MPVQTPPHKIACNHCGWSAYRPSHGDVITPMDKHLMLNCCPKCGSRDQEMRMLNPLEQVFAGPLISLMQNLKQRR